MIDIMIVVGSVIYIAFGFVAGGVYINRFGFNDEVGSLFTVIFYPIVLIINKRFRLLFLDTIERSVKLGVKNIGELLRGE